MAKAFWPGFRWRVLAHLTDGRGRKRMGVRSFDARSGMDRRVSDHPSVEKVELGGDWEFDELVIDHWFHLEQMDVRDWWIGIGNPGGGELGDPALGDYIHVNVHVDGKGKATVMVEEQ